MDGLLNGHVKHRPKGPKFLALLEMQRICNRHKVTTKTGKKTQNDYKETQTDQEGQDDYNKTQKQLTEYTR